jgi:hypothetical protein
LRRRRVIIVVVLIVIILVAEFDDIVVQVVVIASRSFRRSVRAVFHFSFPFHVAGGTLGGHGQRLRG